MKNKLFAAMTLSLLLFGFYNVYAQLRIQIGLNNMVPIPGGTFMMGSPASEVGRNDDEVQHRVTVSSFYMGRYEVTQKEYREVMGRYASWLDDVGDYHPVDCVEWYEAVEYCNRLSLREGLTPAYIVNGENVAWNQNANGYRLPTEAEWEYACRAGTTTPYYSGNSVADAGWYFESYDLTHTHPVGQKQSNPWGLYDMHGNVWEWCWDLYGTYPGGAQTDLRWGWDGPDEPRRVLRGGDCSCYAEYLRSAYRSPSNPYDLNGYKGFRVARNW